MPDFFTTHSKGYTKARVVGMIITLSVAVLWAPLTLADPIDGTNKYAWGENVGWLNFGTPEGAVDVGATELTGYVWGENIGWISLNCSNTASCGTVDYKVSRAAGVFSGYAWGENIGWISFSCANTDSCTGGATLPNVDYGVTMDTVTGIFSGYAWGENIGWVVFNCSETGSCGTVDYKVQAVLAATPTPTPTPTSGGGGTGPTPTPTPSVSPSVSATPSPGTTPTPGVTPSVTPTASPPPVTPVRPPVVNPPVQIIQQIADFLDRLAQRIFGDSVVQGLCAGPLAATACGVTAVGILVIALAILAGLLQSELLAVLFSALQIIGLKRRAKVWGCTYDSVTKRPIPMTKIELFDTSGRVLETRFADRDGRYGFLTSPASLHAQELRVQIRATKPGYTFPSMRAVIGTDYIVYDNVYRGGELVLHGESVLHFNIPMDPVSARRTVFSGLGQGLFGPLGDRILSLAFFIGLIVMPINIWYFPTTKNIIIAAVFLLVNSVRIFALYRPYGRTIDALTGKPLPFALVTLTDMDGKREGFSVSDEYGRYILSGERGKKYEVAITTPANISPQRTVKHQIGIYTRISKRGWVTETLKV